jgi:hypothetical protein
MNLLTVAKTFQTEDAALDYLVSQRWPSGVRCLACDCAKVYRIDTKGKTGRPYRKYECFDCTLHFSATTGTLFQSVEICRAEALRPVPKTNLSPNVKQVLTDSMATYSHILPKEKHTETNHRVELETLGELSMRTIEGAFSLFKRGVIGSYRHLSKDHLDSYLQEVCWR